MKADALVGTTLGTCTLQKLIVQGSMGAVFLAQQSRPRRTVAVKVSLPMMPLSPNQLAEFLARFRREADILALLEHVNIVPIVEYGEREGLVYFVMPYMSGGTLEHLLMRENQLPLEQVASYLDQIAAALDHVHDLGVIHRDVTPANILVGKVLANILSMSREKEERLCLANFGLAKFRSSQGHVTGLGVIGTPDYMSPEQIIGEEVDVRADIYSLGVILYQMVTGVTPFSGKTPMQIADQHLQVSPPFPRKFRSDLTEEVEQVILRSLAKSPSDRYRAAHELAKAFRTVLGNTRSTPVNLRSSSGEQPGFAERDQHLSPSESLPSTGSPLNISRLKSFQDKLEEYNNANKISFVRPTISICYAREDGKLLEGLWKQLRALERQGLIDPWYDRAISPGMDWQKEIDSHLNSADIILLLISSDFMTSDYCYSIEMKQAMERYERREACVIPIILRPVYWQNAPFGKIQALPTDGKPITAWSDHDEAFFNVVGGILTAIKQLPKQASVFLDDSSTNQ